MDVRDVQIPPVFYKTLSPSVPSGAAAQKEEEEKHVIERQKTKMRAIGLGKWCENHPENAENTNAIPTDGPKDLHSDILSCMHATENGAMCIGI